MWFSIRDKNCGKINYIFYKFACLLTQAGAFIPTVCSCIQFPFLNSYCKIIIIAQQENIWKYMNDIN